MDRNQARKAGEALRKLVEEVGRNVVERNRERGGLEPRVRRVRRRRPEVRRWWVEE